MAIEIIAKTKLEDLADQLIEEVAAEQLRTGLFHKTEIIVPNEGIAKFLSQRFAERKGITVGVEYPYLMSWVIKKVFRMPGVTADHGDETSGAADFLADIRPATIAWRIYHHLPDLLQRYREFESLRFFLQNKEPEHLWNLATILGNQFDTIMLQRPDWILAWENNELPADIAQHPSKDVKAEATMQGMLWNAIATPDWKGNHFAAKLQQFQEGNIEPPHFQHPIRIFGFSSIPESVFKLFEQHFNDDDSNIRIYSFEPCDNLFWGDAKSRKEELAELEWNWFNSDKEFSEESFKSLYELYFQNNMLIGSFARNAREFFIRTAEYRGGEESADQANTLELSNDILHTAQNLIKNNSAIGNDGKPLPCMDWKATLQIHSCYSPFREVEAAHDYLLERFAEDPTLRLKDVFILSADPELYAPLVDAVFNNPTIPEANRLNVSVADLQASNVQSSLIAFFQLLDFWRTDFTANDVFAILRQNEIMQKTGFTEDSLLSCSRRVDEAGIRWGWNKEERIERHQYPYGENTWNAGFDRMLTAYALDEPDAVLHTPDEEADIYASTAPGDKEDLGRLIDFTTKLHTLSDIMRERKNKGCDFTEWASFLMETANSFFPENSPIHLTLRSALNNLRLDLSTLETPPQLTSKIMLTVLKEKINIQQSNRNFMNGNITFCSLYPMRSIPAKVICLLGMDHDKFPKSGTKYGFDLIRSVPREGDRSSNLDERQLFLDLILSARDHLFISYTGQGIRDNKPRPPSPCVEELYQWLCSVFGEQEYFRLRHPLQAFSGKYFTEGSPLRSHSEILCRGAQSLAKGNVAAEKIYPAYQEPLQEPLPEDLCRLTLDELLAFFRNPAKMFFKKRLKVYDGQDDSIELSDEESSGFKADWYLKNELLAGISQHDLKTKEAVVEYYTQRLRADAKLPLPPYGEKLFSNDPLSEQLIGFHTKISNIISLEKETCAATVKHFVLGDGPEIKLSLPELTLYKKNNEPATPLIQMIPVLSALYTQQHLELRIHHAAACAMLNKETPLSTVMYLLDGKNGLSAECSSCIDGTGYLLELLRLYVNGMKQILPFIPDTSYACWQTARTNGETGEEAIQKIQNAINSKWYNQYAKAGDEEKFRIFFGPAAPTQEQLLPTAKILFDPILCQKETYNSKKKTSQWEVI